jgi:hypothetical protein
MSGGAAFAKSGNWTTIAEGKGTKPISTGAYTAEVARTNTYTVTFQKDDFVSEECMKR